MTPEGAQRRFLVEDITMFSELHDEEDDSPTGSNAEGEEERNKRRSEGSTEAEGRRSGWTGMGVGKCLVV